MSTRERYTARGINFSHSIDERPKDRDFPLHMHDNYELYCFVSGRASYMVEGNIYELRAGTVLIMRSSETHKLIVNGSERYERFTVTFYPEALCSNGFDKALLAPFTSRALGEKNIYSEEMFGDVSILQLLQKTCRECRVLPKETALYLNLSSMLCAVAYAFENYPTEKNYSHERDVQRELLNYINDNITSELSVNDIAEYIHISPTQLGRIFKELTGTTVYQYIISKRLILAQRYMAKGRSAAEAAEKSGFGDYSCFYRLYKKKFGCSPESGRHHIVKY